MYKNNSDKSYYAAMYLRLSKEDGDLTNGKIESDSISNQKALIDNHLKSMPDVIQSEIYVDDGYTGVNFDRPAFKRMIQDIENGKINMVIVKDLSRFSRDYIDAGKYIQKTFPTVDVRFISILDDFDSLTATESDIHLLLPIKNFVNDSYCRDISKKIRSHQEIMRKSGLYTGAYVSYGYRKDQENINNIVVDEYAAGIVKKMFAWKIKGLNAYAISKKLNSLGILSPSEYKKTLGINYKTGFQKNTKSLWTPQTVKRTLTNRIYIGVLEQGKNKKVNYKVNKVVSLPVQEWNIIEDNHESIVSKTDFEKVNELLKRDLRRSPSAKEVYLFSGMLFCSDCNKLLTRRVQRYKGKEYVSYICSTYNKGKGCSRHSITESELTEIALSAIQNHVTAIASMDAILERIEQSNVSEIDVITNDDEINRLYVELERYDRLSRALYIDLKDELINEEDFRTYKNEYEEIIQGIRNSIEELKAEISDYCTGEISKNKWMEEVKSYQNINTLNRTILVSLVDKILISEDETLTFVMRYQDSFKALVRFTDSASRLIQHEGIRKHG